MSLKGDSFLPTGDMQDVKQYCDNIMVPKEFFTWF